MPRRAQGRPLIPSAKSRPQKRTQSRQQVLNALEVAERETPEKVKVRQHRLGEIESDSDELGRRGDNNERSVKRRKVANESTGLLEDVDEGTDLEGGNWHEGINDNDEDDEIDSEEAFGESDQENFADFTFRGSGSPFRKHRRKDADSQTGREPSSLNDTSGWHDASTFNNDDGGAESDQIESASLDDIEDDFGDEGVDLTTAWDMDDEDEKILAEAARRKQLRSNKRLDSGARRFVREEASDSYGKAADEYCEDDEDDNDQREEEEEGEEDEDEDEDDDDDDDDDEASAFSVSEDSQGDFAGLRNFVEKLTSQNVEKESKGKPGIAAPLQSSSRSRIDSSKLSASDLLQYVTDPTQRQSLKMLQANERGGPADHRGDISGRLSAPLPKRQQDKLDRAAAYDKSKETLNRWIETVKQNRRADHVLFPLPDPAALSAINTKQMNPIEPSAPANELEATIQSIMDASKAGGGDQSDLEDQEQAIEELEEKKIPLEEVRERRAKLRLARELLFREEIKAKRIKKIKSKAFRRVHRKDRDRKDAQARELLAQSGLLDSDEERERMERRRAEERMGARHRESRWAKSLKESGRALWDDEARAGMSDLARRDDELRKRIEGKNVAHSDASSTESESESEVMLSEDEDRRIKQRLDVLGAPTPTGPGSTLNSMAFMQRAAASRKAESEEQLRQIRRAMESNTDDAENSDVQPEVNGRQKFGVRAPVTHVTPHRKDQRREFEAPISEDEDEDEEQRGHAVGAHATEALKVPDKSVLGNTLTMKESSGQHHGARNSQSDHEARTNATIPPTKSPLKGVSGQKQQSLNDETSFSGEDEPLSPTHSFEDKVTLANAIFAGPEDSFEEFTKEKKQTEEEEGDQIVDNALPGWGSWAGAGISKRELKKGKGRFLTKIKGVAPERRQDARLDRVIINEKRNKRNSKYLATELPHPFENRQQYERSLRLPLGPEWGTSNHFQDAIKPRILVTKGSVIKPIAKPLA